MARRLRLGVAVSGGLAVAMVVLGLGWAWPGGTRLGPAGAMAFVDKPIDLPPGNRIGRGLECRSAVAKKALLELFGGDARSEQAVADGLTWIVAHQQADGGWSFEHGRAPACQGKCVNPGGAADARNAATALALLPLLGAGHTHRAGPYKEAVKRALDFLAAAMKLDPDGGNLSEQAGMMYSHGLASIALAEAYALTRDPKLSGPAQKAIDFICNAQDPVGGGWRYMPRQKGDTSVFGWQMAALRAGQIADLKVPQGTLDSATVFLDAVQADGGATYGYVDPGNGPATSAIGLLGRMHQGWKKDSPALTRGAEQLAARPFSPANYYANYYAAQVLRNLGGDLWRQWNAKTRDGLVGDQSREGHAKGSWYQPLDIGAARGGRLYCTSMAVLTLEVYYRYPPIYLAVVPPGRSRPGVLEVRPE